MDSEREQIRAAQEGNAFALATLLEDQYAAVYRFLCKLTLDSTWAADLSQECMIRAIDHFTAYDPDRALLSTWLIAIAKNLWLDDCRRRKRKPAVSLEDADGELGDFAAELAEKDAVLAAVGHLSPKLRAPVALYYGQGYAYDEIAQILHVPVGTVKSRMARALTKLRKELDDHAE
ncbi:sigma-70 family RNA polymerase sigma factor [Ethanoligenens sp.]|uniref:sigma-70 family RNA polymerase sigma factor n=1 Tax=Ethanoligenens sp. TaxID=2099655 RepID=UPI0039E8964E